MFDLWIVRRRVERHVERGTWQAFVCVGLAVAGAIALAKVLAWALWVLT